VNRKQKKLEKINKNGAKKRWPESWKERKRKAKNLPLYSKTPRIAEVEKKRFHNSSRGGGLILEKTQATAVKTKKNLGGGATRWL